jgi:excisionase family DNA binding protein
MAKTETLYYSTSELATLLGVARSTVIDRAREGVLPAIRFGRLWRFPKKKIDSWLEQEQTARSSVSMAPRAAWTDYQQRLFQVLALAEELDPVIEAGTLKPIDVDKVIQANREERMGQILSE